MAQFSFYLLNSNNDKASQSFKETFNTLLFVSVFCIRRGTLWYSWSDGNDASIFDQVDIKNNYPCLMISTLSTIL